MNDGVVAALAMVSSIILIVLGVAWCAFLPTVGALWLLGMLP